MNSADSAVHSVLLQLASPPVLAALIALACAVGVALGVARALRARRSPSAELPLPAHGLDHTLEAAVVPEADPEGLLKPKGYVVLRADAEHERLDEALKEYVKQKIGVWKYPRWIEVVDALPKTATGKIQRFKLREKA